MVLHNLGNRIREERKRAHLTQEQLAELVNCNESYIGQIERGVKNPSLEVIVNIANLTSSSPGRPRCSANPSLEVIVNIANALNVTVDHLLADSVKVAHLDGLIDEAVSLLKDRDPEDVRFIITITRLFMDLLDKKKH
ncbi:helix-turn-helix domain-containing protein [Desulfocucumis palustris]|uniref:helix-turn-helix domain-containing protein n=1 Tax=Desulfocucumis palustris TaxID=1898651 RepID=UPI0013FD31C5|nr:helix-turn-helix transcriptional regulator [Desulfocucumis palustris]